MISEAAITGKPVYVARMSHRRNIDKFERFYTLFKDLGIIRNLEDKIEHWIQNGKQKKELYNDSIDLMVEMIENPKKDFHMNFDKDPTKSVPSRKNPKK